MKVNRERLKAKVRLFIDEVLSLTIHRVCSEVCTSVYPCTKSLSARVSSFRMRLCNSRTNSSRKHWVFEKPRLQHTRESPRPQARGHTGVPQVTSVTGPQAQTLDRSATSSTDPTAPLFAKSWLPDMGIYTLFMVAQQERLPLRTDVWALGMQCKAVKFS